MCTVPNCVLYLATFCYISLEKTRLPVLSDPRLVFVPADNTPDGFFLSDIVVPQTNKASVVSARETMCVVSARDILGTLGNLPWRPEV